MLRCLKPNIILSKRFITEYLTSSRLVTEKPCYLFNSLVSPHAFSVDCNALLRNGETVNADILLNLKTQYEQCLHGYAPPIYFNRGLYVELVGEILEVFDDCGDTSDIEDWDEYNDGLNPADNQVYVKEGSHSMALGIDADKDAGDIGYWRNDVSQGDFSAYSHDWLYLWIYCSTIDYFISPGNAFRYYIGHDEVVMRFYFTKANLSVGWNLIKCDFDNPTVGDTDLIDWTDINRQYIQVYTSVGNVNDFTIYVDSLMFVRPFSGATDGITKGATVQYLIDKP